MDAELRSMVMSFRVAELQALLGFAGKNKSGRKNELQARCLEMCKAKSPPIVMKIKDLYRSTQISNLGQPYSGTASGYTAGTTASSLVRSGSGYSDSKYVQENHFGKSIGYQRVISGDGQCRTVPICPDVKLKELPFYDIQGILIRPTSLINQPQSPKQETQQTFCLSPSQAADISGSREVVVAEGSGGIPITKVQYTTQVQLRFCALDSSEEQDDLFPPNLVVKVNGRLIQLPQPIPSNRPGVEPKRPSKPLNITNNVKCCPHSTNTVHVQWVTDNTKNYAMSVFMVKRLTAEELFQRLKGKRIQPADFTRGRIKEITSSEEEDLCAPTSISVSIACPLGKNRMSYPCRATTCKHLQCFDANAFLLMNEKKPSFICPVCNKHLKFDDLSIDGYFMDVIKNLSFDAGNEIELFPDGHWEPVVKIKSEPSDYPPPSKRIKTDNNKSLMNETIDLDDEVCIVDDVKPVMSSGKVSDNKRQTSEPEVIDLIDSDDDEEPTRQSAPPSPVATEPVEQNPEEDDEDEVGIRPRRRKPRINYVEETSSDSSSTNEGDGASAPGKSKRNKSPAFIELSDSPASSPSPEPVQQRRAFSSVGSHSSKSSSSTSSHTNRSGSGTSTLYSASATTPPITGRTGIGHDNFNINPADRGNVANAETPYSSLSATNFQNMNPPQSSSPFAPLARAPSSNVFSASINSSNHSLVPSSSTPSSFFFSSQAQLPGYSSSSPYNPRANWQSDLNPYINPQVTHGQMDMTTYDYSFFNTSSYHLGYDPRGGGAPGSGENYNNWM